MKTMSIKAYAVAHKISIYSVVQLIKKGSLKTETKKTDGKDELFILVSEEPRQEATAELPAETEKIEDYKKAYMRLNIKYNQLQVKYDALQKTIFPKEVL